MMKLADAADEDANAQGSESGHVMSGSEAEPIDAGHVRERAEAKSNRKVTHPPMCPLANESSDHKLFALDC